MIESTKERMEVIANMLGLELDEEFDIQGNNYNPYKFTECGLVDREGSAESELSQLLLMENSAIIKRPKAPAEPWKPKEGEYYYYVRTRGQIECTAYYPDDYLMDALNYRIGNCFPDAVTALVNKNIILQKLETPEFTPASWTPEYGEKYWFFNHVRLCSVVWTGSLIDHMFRDVGNFYRTEAEALAVYPNISKRLGMPESDA